MSVPKIKPGCTSVSSSQDRPQRLFFALWPDDSTRQQLVSGSKPLVQVVRGRPVPVENLHITLAFLGNVEAHQRACVECVATSICSSPFELVLDRFGHWSRSRVLWFGLGDVPDSLIRLADALAVGSRECGLSVDARPFRPHLTLMRKVLSVPERKPVEPMSWRVDRFVLVRSVAVPQGVSYEVVREWRL